MGRVRQVVAVLLLACAAATVAGLVVLWPAHHHFRADAQYDGAAPSGSLPATVTSVRNGTCDVDATGRTTFGPASGTGTSSGYACIVVAVVLHGGPQSGQPSTLALTPGVGTPPISRGDRIRVVAVDVPGGTQYAFFDFDRRRPLLLFALFAALVLVVVARLRGLAAVLGLAAGVAAVVGFVIPAILSGESALPVALTGSAALLFVLLYAVHGPSLRTSCALLGTLAGLGLVGVLSYAGVHLVHLFGQDEDTYTAVQAFATRVDIRSLIIGGFVVGAIGALNDLTVTQASAVWELRSANRELSARETYAAAMRVGRDHVASAAYTLVFAYVGTALPVLLIITLSDQAVLDAITSDSIAIEIVAALVGVIGLVLVVPITTALSVVVARSAPASSLKVAGHTHAV